MLRQKDIEIQEISIQKEDRYLVEIYMEKSNITDIDYIEKILNRRFEGKDSIKPRGNYWDKAQLSCLMTNMLWQ